MQDDCSHEIRRFLVFRSKAMTNLVLGCVVLCCSVVSNSCDPMDCSSPGSSVHGDSPGKNTGMSCHALLQGIFPTQGLNLGLPHCRQILSHWGSPRILEWVAYSLPRGNFLTQESNWGLLHCSWILYQLSYLGGPPFTLALQNRKSLGTNLTRSM